MVRAVASLHDPSSQLLGSLLAALGDGKLCVVDISRMRGSQGLALAGVLLQHIFDHNQDEFTEAEPRTIPTIAVIEEAQSVLGGNAMSGDSPFVAWVKEGRKYDLGAVLVTQQPGSLSGELLSQGDNWFVFHLLSSGDLSVLKRANAHFSDDLLSSLLNEPLPGHGVFWSSSGGRPYPIPLRALLFNDAHPCRDPDYSGAPLDNYASHLLGRFESALRQAAEDAGGTASVGDRVDVSHTLKAAAIARLRAVPDFEIKMRSERGMPWGEVQSLLAEAAPDTVPDKRQWAYNLVSEALSAIFGAQDRGWTTERRPRANDPSTTTAWVKALGPAQSPRGPGETPLF